MSEELSEKAFESVAEDVDKAHKQAVAAVKAKVEKAKTEALNKISS